MPATTADNDLLATHRAAVQAAVRELALPLQEPQAIALAERVERALRLEHGGTTVYLPVLTTIAKRERNAAIRRDYANGARLAVIAASYGLSESRVRQIVAR